MSLDILTTSQPEPYDLEEEIQLMDTDETNLQVEEQSTVPAIDVVQKQKQQENTDDKLEEVPSLVVIEKRKVYIRDGPDTHHVEAIPVDEKYYELPTTEQLASIELLEEKMKDILESLNLTIEDFRTLSSLSGNSRPESLYIRGVTNMSTQEIFNCFEEFKPIGIEWVCDHSCNIFWYDTLTPIHLLAIKTIPGPTISHRRPVNYDHAMRLNKRKASSLSSNDRENNSADVALPPGHWREGSFQKDDKPESTIKLYIRYTTLDDRKVRGAENQSEYYRQYGNPNYNNMTGLISRSKKRSLNAMKPNKFRDFTVIKSNDPTATSSDIVEEIPLAPEDNTPDAKVKFTVVLPPEKISATKDEEDDYEGDHRSKRQRRRSWTKDDDEEERRRKEKTHFTVTMDSAAKTRRDSKSKVDETSKSNTDDHPDDEESKPVTDARQILERKRRNRR
ncbi:unnamed protein product [Adineta steineri]|uniref:Nuclear cap-binding protein subunit 3 n=1 Tax=Adineta steineri TaxID=433720 RepID=A0A815K429_9BILA|nr:unnamed protein product [Adineta steineri]CAF3897267.1 unnamed protein product [Adineta steineri]